MFKVDKGGQTKKDKNKKAFESFVEGNADQYMPGQSRSAVVTIIVNIAYCHAPIVNKETKSYFPPVVHFEVGVHAIRCANSIATDQKGSSQQQGCHHNFQQHGRDNWGRFAFKEACDHRRRQAQ